MGISVALQAERELFLGLPDVFSMEVTGLIYTHRAAWLCLSTEVSLNWDLRGVLWGYCADGWANGSWLVQSTKIVDTDYKAMLWEARKGDFSSTKSFI